MLRLFTPHWDDYELLDSGHGLKLERFGKYQFVRPEAQAAWKPALSVKVWDAAHAAFADGEWRFRQPIEPRWQMHYKDVRFWSEATPFRHLGVFPEQAAQWDWMVERIKTADRPIRLLNLFAYTGIATLMAAAAGAQVTHIDSAKNTVAWARENAELSGLSDRPIRWIVDDALKFTEREVRRGVKYDAILMDPPPFGHGAKGEVWKFDKSLPLLLDACRAVLSETPLLVMITAYTAQATPSSLDSDLAQMLSGYRGRTESGTLSTRERSGGRSLQLAMFARWHTG